MWRGMARDATGRGPRCMSEPRSKIASGSRERDCSGKDVSTLPGVGYSLASVSRAFLRVPRRPLASLPHLLPHEPTHRVKRPRRLRLSLSFGSPGLWRFPPPPPERRASLPGLRDDRRRPPRGSERLVRVVHPTRPRRFGPFTAPPGRSRPRRSVHHRRRERGPGGGHARRAAKDSIDDVRGQVIQQTLEDPNRGNGWVVARVAERAEPSGSREVGVDCDAAFRERQRGLPETEAVSASTRVFRLSTSGTSSSNTARALGVPSGGRDATRGCRDPHRGGPPARWRVARARRGRRRRRIWCGWRCVPCRRPRARGPARGSPRRRARRRRGRRRAGAGPLARTRARGARRWTWPSRRPLGGVPSTIETTSRRDAREGVARRARGPTRARRTKPPASERRRDDAREARCARTRTKTHEADARDAKKIFVVRYHLATIASSHQRQTWHVFLDARPGTTNRSPLYAALRHPNPSC